MSTVILNGDSAPSELYHNAFMAGRCGDLIDTTYIADRDDVDFEYLLSEWEEGRAAALADNNEYAGV